MNCTKQEVDQRNTQIVSDYQAGAKRRELAMKYNLGINALTVVLKKNDVEIRNEKVDNVLGLDESMVLDLYSKGKSGHEIAELYNVSTRPIYRILNKYNSVKQRVIDESEIVSRYTSGQSITQIKRELNTSSDSVNKVLNAHSFNFNRRSGIRGRELDLINDYQNGLTIRQVCKKYSTNSRTFYALMKEHSISIRDASESRRKYKIDECFFDNIDSEEKAYFLGFLYADGCNHTNSNSIAITLQEQDLPILQQFQRLISTDSPIKKRCVIETGKSYYTLCFTSRKLSQRLTELGCVPKKSLILTFPAWLDESNLPHFIRGVFDGDGHVKFKGKYSRFQVTGNPLFIKSMGEILSIFCGVNVFYTKHKVSAIIDLRVSGRRQQAKVLAFLYKDATIYLSRKKLEADLILSPMGQRFPT